MSKSSHDKLLGTMKKDADAAQPGSFTLHEFHGSKQSHHILASTKAGILARRILIGAASDGLSAQCRTLSMVLRYSNGNILRAADKDLRLKIFCRSPSIHCLCCISFYGIAVTRVP